MTLVKITWAKIWKKHCGAACRAC